MRIDIGDLLVFVGAVMVLAGLWLLDWRLALVAAGLKVLALGVARLTAVARRTED